MPCLLQIILPIVHLNIPMKKILSIFVILSLVGCSTIRSPSLTEAAVLDTVSTQIAINNGFQESNPIGFPAATFAKIVILSYIKNLEDDNPKKKLYHQLGSSVWTGASINNFALILGVSNTISLFLGIITSLIVYTDIKDNTESVLVQSDNQNKNYHD
jgi:hypothetical protein